MVRRSCRFLESWTNTSEWVDVESRRDFLFSKFLSLTTSSFIFCFISRRSSRPISNHSSHLPGVYLLGSSHPPPLPMPPMPPMPGNSTRSSGLTSRINLRSTRGTSNSNSSGPAAPAPAVEASQDSQQSELESEVTDSQQSYQSQSTVTEETMDLNTRNLNRPSLEASHLKIPPLSPKESTTTNLKELLFSGLGLELSRTY